MKGITFLFLALILTTARGFWINPGDDNEVELDDNEICAETAENPQNYLVPDLEDCTNFYSCQDLGGDRGFKAHLLSCPAGTAFDLELRICNFVDAVPRCQEDRAVL